MGAAMKRQQLVSARASCAACGAPMTFSVVDGKLHSIPCIACLTHNEVHVIVRDSRAKLRRTITTLRAGLDDDLV